MPPAAAPLAVGSLSMAGMALAFWREGAERVAVSFIGEGGSIPITGTSVNPARSFGPALIAGGWPFGQVWLFLVVPLIGGCLAGLVGRIGVLSPLPPPPPETLP